MKGLTQFAFPKVDRSGCNRSFQHRWLDKYPWLVYSKKLDGDYCLLRTRLNLGVLVNKPFTALVKVHKIVDGHTTHQYHAQAVEDGLTFNQSIEHPERNIGICMSTENVSPYHKEQAYCKILCREYLILWQIMCCN